MTLRQRTWFLLTDDPDQPLVVLLAISSVVGAAVAGRADLLVGTVGAKDDGIGIAGHKSLELW